MKLTTAAPGRSHPSEFKLNVVLAALRGDAEISALAERFRVHPSQIRQWKKQLLRYVYQYPRISLGGELIKPRYGKDGASTWLGNGPKMRAAVQFIGLLVGC